MISIGNIVAVTLIPKKWENTLGSVLHWAASRWFYDEQTQKLAPFKQKDLCLEGDLDSFTLSLDNCSSSSQNQRFVYNQAEKELFWINPITNGQHPIYVEKDCTRISRGPFTQKRPYISKNPVSKWIADQTRRFENGEVNASKLITSMPRVSRLRALALYSLQKALPNMTSIEYQKYVEMLEFLREREFGYFMSKENRYLLCDGYTVIPSKINSTNFKYYGLWYLNDDNHLVHFLSGKRLQAIPNYASKSIKLLENILPSQMNLSKINDTFYDLKVHGYARDFHNAFVTVVGRGEQHQLYIHNNGIAKKVGGTIMTQGANVFLAFIEESTYDKVCRLFQQLAPKPSEK